MIWSELDCYDQLVLVRLLAHYATQRRPQRLELINWRWSESNHRAIRNLRAGR